MLVLVIVLEMRTRIDHEQEHEPPQDESASVDTITMEAPRTPVARAASLPMERLMLKFFLPDSPLRSY